MKSKLIDLGWSIAKLDYSEESYTLKIFCPSSNEDNFYTPSSDVAVYGEKNIKALRDALDEALQESSRNR